MGDKRRATMQGGEGGALLTSGAGRQRRSEAGTGGSSSMGHMGRAWKWG